MQIIVHRGTHQIGGCITEIRSEKARIFIDMGSELTAIDSVPSPDIVISGLTQGIPDCDAVFFTHYHGDHIGLFEKILPGIDLFLGEAAKKIFLTLYKRIKGTMIDRAENFKTYSEAKPVIIKDITITPFQVDHSAYDAYMFLIEVDGKKVLHTGDYRDHGIRGETLLNTLKSHVGQVDVLITEGTQFSRRSIQISTEMRLLETAKMLLADNKYVFVLCSSTNIDRIATFHNATPIGKYFVCDDYQKDVLNTIKEKDKTLESIYSFNKVITYGNNLLPKLIARGFCMLIRNNQQFQQIMKNFDKDQSLVIYSMWKGYLKDKSNGISELISEFPWKYYLHTSGHADRQTITKVCMTVKPLIGIIPIHSDKPDEIDGWKLPFKILHMNDGEEIII